MTSSPSVSDLPASEPIPPIDFASYWRERLLKNDNNGPMDAEADRQFWRSFAPHYDSRTGGAGSYDQTLDVLLELVQPEDTVLDAGAGTGRLAIPLTNHVQRVTAIDQSPEMLGILMEKAKAQGIQNVTTEVCEIERATLEPHDVVLSAWALYRQLNLDDTFRKLAAATRRCLVIVAGDSTTPPHRRLIEQVWGRINEPGFPAYLYMLGVMRQVGLRADVRIVREERLYRGATPQEIAQCIAPIKATEEEVEEFTTLLQPLLQNDGDEWCYQVAYPAAILIWRRGQEPDYWR